MRELRRHDFQLGSSELATWDLPDDQPDWLECRVWLDHGDFPRLGFPNGPSDSNNRLLNYFLDNKESCSTRSSSRIWQTTWTISAMERLQLVRVAADSDLENRSRRPAQRQLAAAKATARFSATSPIEADGVPTYCGGSPAGPGGGRSPPTVAPFVKLVATAEAAGQSPPGRHSRRTESDSLPAPIFSIARSEATRCRHTKSPRGSPISSGRRCPTTS